jgi:hypothetical protein
MSGLLAAFRITSLLVPAELQAVLRAPTVAQVAQLEVVCESCLQAMP